MNNIMKVVLSGRCTGCSACNDCEHITFSLNEQGFYAPTVDENCNECGKCIDKCIYSYQYEEDTDE